MSLRTVIKNDEILLYVKTLCNEIRNYITSHKLEICKIIGIAEGARKKVFKSENQNVLKSITELVSEELEIFDAPLYAEIKRPESPEERRRIHQLDPVFRNNNSFFEKFNNIIKKCNNRSLLVIDDTTYNFDVLEILLTEINKRIGEKKFKILIGILFIQDPWAKVISKKREITIKGKKYPIFWAKMGGIMELEWQVQDC